MPVPPSDSTVALWYHYEEIAMHFNQLIMQFRLQVIAGAGAIGTAASYLIGEKVKKPIDQDWLRATISSGLWVLILCAAILDLSYYNELLRGAVDALIDFEKAHPDIQMSTKIKARVGAGEYAVWWAYGLLLGLLLLYILGAWSVYVSRHALWPGRVAGWWRRKVLRRT